MSNFQEENFRALNQHFGGHDANYKPHTNPIIYGRSPYTRNIRMSEKGIDKACSEAMERANKWISEQNEQAIKEGRVK